MEANKLVIQALTKKAIKTCRSITEAENFVFEARELGDKTSVIQVYASKGETW